MGWFGTPFVIFGIPVYKAKRLGVKMVLTVKNQFLTLKSWFVKSFMFQKFSQMALSDVQSSVGFGATASDSVTEVQVVPTKRNKEKLVQL
ncbi:hypothetical protein HanIR_Chr09g0448511 [Helianthus annuus]|nr:hypothetical protein HanIR_Chr09g0448511 [Helianthus annuus]